MVTVNVREFRQWMRTYGRAEPRTRILMTQENYEILCLLSRPATWPSFALTSLYGLGIEVFDDVFHMGRRAEELKNLGVSTISYFGNQVIPIFPKQSSRCTEGR